MTFTKKPPELIIRSGGGTLGQYFHFCLLSFGVRMPLLKVQDRVVVIEKIYGLLFPMSELSGRPRADFMGCGQFLP
jgi:hypothetical protein